MKKNIKIAITGGIGSGKSVVSNIVQQLGYPVINADDIAKELMQSDDSIKKRILKAFGKESYTDNIPNTKYLAEKVFSNKENVQKINAIMHPVTIKKIEELSKNYFLKHKVVFVESALVYEAKLDKSFDFIILIYSDKKIRIERSAKRSNITETEIKRRMESQIPDDKKKERVHFVIENNSSVEDLKSRTFFVINLIGSFVK
jgi:dephospho-CoA kinase